MHNKHNVHGKNVYSGNFGQKFIVAFFIVKLKLNVTLHDEFCCCYRESLKKAAEHDTISLSVGHIFQNIAS